MPTVREDKDDISDDSTVPYVRLRQTVISDKVQVCVRVHQNLSLGLDNVRLRYLAVP
jgi:hypothetical protein